MTENRSENQKRIDRLTERHTLDIPDYEALYATRTPEDEAYASSCARRIRETVYGKDVFLRGIVEFSNICRNDCLYCGIRKSNPNLERYRLTEEDILGCCREGYDAGMRTFVLQSGEDGAFTDDVLVPILEHIRRAFPDCAITLSIGERSRESYERLYRAGADRYLLRHETADPCHYEKLHPPELSFWHRINCLYELRDVGFAVGAGMMVGSPFQTPHEIAEDLKFLEVFRPEMCGIGPFIPHHDTPFRDFQAGTLEDTLFLLSLIRIIHPTVLLPATTALGTIDPHGREKGFLAGANVVMPNLSPQRFRSQYALYDNKLHTDADAEAVRRDLEERARSAGYRIVVDRGDPRLLPAGPV